MSATPSIIVVPGAWHLPPAYAPLTSLLETSGYTVVTIDLPSIDSVAKTGKPLEGIEEDTKAIRAAIEAEIAKEKDVLVFMHSYGSVPAGEAVQGLDKTSVRKNGGQGGVMGLFYCAAFALPKGVSLINALGDKPLPWFQISEDEKIVNPEDPAKVFYADASKELVSDILKNHLKPHSYRTMFSKTTWEPYREIPSFYLYCQDDQALPYEVQQGMIGGMKGNVKWESDTLKTSHSPFLSEPDKTARIVRRVAGEQGV